MSVTIELPSEIENKLASEWGDLPRITLESLAVEGYRLHKLTRAQVGRLLGLDFWQTEAFLKEREAYLDYSVEDLARERETHRQLFGK